MGITKFTRHVKPSEIHTIIFGKLLYRNYQNICTKEKYKDGQTIGAGLGHLEWNGL